MGPIRMRPDVGTYQLTLSGGTSPNYETHYGTSGMRVDPRPVTVTVDNKTRVYGSPNPTFTATVTGMPAGVTLPTSFETMPRDLGVGTRTIQLRAGGRPQPEIESGAGR